MSQNLNEFCAHSIFWARKKKQINKQIATTTKSGKEHYQVQNVHRDVTADSAMRLITSVDRSDILNSKNGGQFVLWLCGAVQAENCLGCFSSSEFPLQLCSFPPMGGFLPLSYWESATGVTHIGSSCFAAFSALPLIHKSIYGMRMLGKAGRMWKGSLDCANCTLGIAKHAIV